MTTVIIEGKTYSINPGDLLIVIGRDVVVNKGIVGTLNEPHADQKITIEGELLNVNSLKSIVVKGTVEGNVNAGDSVSCQNVAGNVASGSSVTCSNVGVNVSSGGSANCGDVGGNVSAAGSVKCRNINGKLTAGGNVSCDSKK